MYVSRASMEYIRENKILLGFFIQDRHSSKKKKKELQIEKKDTVIVMIE